MCGLSRWGRGYPGQLPWWPLCGEGVPWSTSMMTTSRGEYPGQLPWWPLLGEGTYPGPLPWWPLPWWPLPGGTLVNFHDDLFWGEGGREGTLVHFHDDHFHDDHFWGVPCDLLFHNAVHVISALQTPKWWVWLGAHASVAPKDCGKVTWDPPKLNRLTDKHEWKHYLPAYYICGR